MPGQYTVRLTANGNSYTQPLTITIDPRVKTSLPDLQQQFSLSQQLYQDAMNASEAVNQVRGVREELQRAKSQAGQGGIADAIDAFEKKLDEVGGPEQQGFGGGRVGAPAPDTLSSVRSSLMLLMGMVQGADVAPTVPQMNAAADRHKALPPLMTRWIQLQSQDLAALNSQLRAAGLPEITVEGRARVTIR